MVLGSNPADATSLRNFGNSVYPALLVSFGGTVGPVYLVSMPGEVKYRTPGVNVYRGSTTLRLEKDNSYNNPAYNTQV